MTTIYIYFFLKKKKTKNKINTCVFYYFKLFLEIDFSIFKSETINFTKTKHNSIPFHSIHKNILYAK